MRRMLLLPVVVVIVLVRAPLTLTVPPKQKAPAG